MNLLKNYKLIIGFCIVLYAVIVSFLYKGSLDTINTLESTNNSLISDLQQQERELLTQKLSCIVQKQTIGEDCDVRLQVIKDSHSLLIDLDKIPVTRQSGDEKHETVDIGAALPADVIRVLQQADNNYKNRASDSK